jgi:hypothetical protein
MSLADELQKLVDLFRAGMLTREEFESAKKRLIAGQSQSGKPSASEATPPIIPPKLEISAKPVWRNSPSKTRDRRKEQVGSPLPNPSLAPHKMQITGARTNKGTDVRPVTLPKEQTGVFDGLRHEETRPRTPKLNTNLKLSGVSAQIKRIQEAMNQARKRWFYCWLSLILLDLAVVMIFSNPSSPYPDQTMAQTATGLGVLIVVFQIVMIVFYFGMAFRAAKLAWNMFPSWGWLYGTSFLSSIAMLFVADSSGNDFIGSVGLMGFLTLLLGFLPLTWFLNWRVRVIERHVQPNDWV